MAKNPTLSFNRQPTAKLQSWSVHAHLETPEHQHFALFVNFDLVNINHDPAYYLSWSLIDIERQKYYSTSEVDPRAPEIGIKTLLDSELIQDKRFSEALREVFEKGKIPLPSRIIQNEIHQSDDYLQYGDGSLKQNTNGTFTLNLNNSITGIFCELTLEPVQNIVKHDSIMLFPHLDIRGEIKVNQHKHIITNGNAILTYEFRTEALESIYSSLKRFAINQLNIQLSNGNTIYLRELVDKTNSTSFTRFAVIVSTDGNVKYLDNFTLFYESDKKHQWRSPTTFNLYPLRWELSIPAIDLQLTLVAKIPNQEFISLSQFNFIFWTGTCGAQGIQNKQDVTGNAFISRYGFNTVNNVKQFFSSVSDEVYKHIEELIPLHSTREKWRKIIATKINEQVLDGIDFEQLSQALIQPIRTIADRQGKAWRSYIILACCNAVGGDFTPYLPLLTFELVHVGSLIVDDVEDKSLVRRGGPACHLIFGEPIAINAGEAAYLLPQILFEDLFKDLSKEKVCEIYEHYFQAIHGSHAGQALDISGADELVKAVIEGKAAGDEIVARVTAIHKLKSGVPAETLFARIGAILGNGTKQQIDSLGAYIEALGTAFQIIDDVLNLRGFQGESKTQGEDIREGKVTFPVAMAYQYLSKAEYHQLLQKIIDKPQDEIVISEIIDQLEKSGAINASVATAQQMIEQAWVAVDPLIEESFAKIMLRVFGRYIIERHY